MTIDEQIIARYIDGNLNKDELAEVERELNNNPELFEVFDHYLSQNHTLRSWADEINNEPLPDSISQLLYPPKEKSVSLQGKLMVFLQRLGDYVVAPVPLAMATFLFAAISLVLLPKGDIKNDKRLYAFLDGELVGSSSKVGDSVITQKMAFYLEDGSFCKLYQSSKEIGVACKTQELWSTRVKTNLDISDHDKDLYITASNHLPEKIETFIKSNIRGNPLTPEQEKQL